MDAGRAAVYDQIGGSYTAGRREDPRIARTIWAAVQAFAEGLPFASNEFDAAMGVLTIHHWTDRRQGLAELRRVARDRIVLFLRDPDVCRWWMSALALISDSDREAGLRALSTDLERGEWQRQWGHLLECDELDLGYRVLVARC